MRRTVTFRLTGRHLAYAFAIAARLTTFTVLATAAPEAVFDGIAPNTFPPHQTLVVRGDVFHVQGLEIDDSFVYVSSVDTDTKRALLHKFSTGGTLVGTAALTDGPRYHPGGIAQDASSIWIPVAEYVRSGSTRIVRVDKTTLTAISSFTVPDHIGALAIKGDRIYGANWDARHLYVWDIHGQLLQKVRNPTDVAYQDMKIVGDALVASGVMRHQLTGAIDWLDADTLQPRRRVLLGRTENWALWTREGMTIRDGKLFLMPHDGNGRATDIGIFALDAMESLAFGCTPASGTADPCATAFERKVTDNAAPLSN